MEWRAKLQTGIHFLLLVCFVLAMHVATPKEEFVRTGKLNRPLLTSLK